MGYHVLRAHSVADAIQVASAHHGPIDLVLSDVVMPGGTGRMLIEELQVARPGIRTLYMSGYPADDVVRHGVEGGMPFLQKPFTLAALARKVRETLEAPPSPPPPV
jgi:DNA-binding NtrC family response regulator